MSQGIESGVGGLWSANQAALGTQAATSATSTLRLRKATDDTLKSNKTHGREPFVDGAAYDNSAAWVETVAGDVGQFVFQAQIENTTAVFARHIGGDTVTGAADPWTHTLTSGTTNPVNQTIREKTGVNVGPYRAAWWDAIYNKLNFHVGHDQNIAHVTAGIQALKAAEIGSLTDPVAVDSGTDPWKWGEATTAVKIGGVAFSEVIGETLDLDRGWTTQQGDSVEPIMFVPGRGAINRTFDGAVTDTLLPQILNALYGSTTPTVGTRPTSAPVFASLDTTYTRSATRTLQITTPKVEIQPDNIVIGTKPQGGLIPIAFGGQCMAGGSPAITIIGKTGDSVSYIT